MPLRKQDTINNGMCCLILVLVGLLAYWPLTLGMFSLKNDATTYFLPWRYQVSQSIQNGHFPFWSPYLYTGLPVHADIQSGVWNPVVFIISLFTTYNMTVLQWETVLYILIGGISFFRLCSFFFTDKKLSLLLSMSYMCCGFMIDSGSFIAWIASAAYLPLVLFSFLKIMQIPSLRNAIILALSCSLLFLAGYTSFFIITIYILALIFIIRLFGGDRSQRKEYAFRLLTYLVIAVICCLIICSPALISYIQFFPYYKRVQGLSLYTSQTNSFGIGNFISYIFPQASYKLLSGNDISAKNAYMGILPLVFIFYSFKYRFTTVQKIISGIVVLCILFSLGNATPLHAFFYHILPLADTFRHPASTRLFTTVGLLLLAGFGWSEFMKSTDRLLHKLIYLFVAGIILFALYELLIPGNAARLAHDIAALSPGKDSVKKFLDNTTFSDWVIIGSAIQVFFLLLSLKKRFLLPLWAANIFIMFFLSMPFTLVSQHKPAEVNAFVQSFPGGFPLSQARNNTENKVNDSSAVTVNGYSNFYKKNISIQDHVITPTFNSKYGELLSDTNLRNEISLHPFAYSENAVVTIKRFSPNSFSFDVTHGQSAVLHITQQYNSNWHAYADGIPLVVLPDNIAFMKVVVPGKLKDITLVYKPTMIIIASFVSILVILVCAILLFNFRWIKK